MQGIAPTILAAAGILKHKRATVFADSKKSQVKFLEEHGASYTGAHVEVDGQLITGDGPDSADEFGKKFAQMIC